MKISTNFSNKLINAIKSLLPASSLVDGAKISSILKYRRDKDEYV